MNLRAKWDQQTEARARREIVEKLLAGDKVGDLDKVDLEHVLDDAINGNVAGFVRDQYELLASIGSRDSNEACLRIHDWLKVKCESYVGRHADLISDYLDHEARELELEGADS